MKKAILSLSLICVSSFLFAQSPWTKEKGGGFSQLSFTMIPEYNMLFSKSADGKQEFVETERYATDNTIQSYNEIGIADDWTAMVIIPFKMQTLGTPVDESLGKYWSEEGSLNNFSNISLALRRGFKISSFQSALQLKVDLRTFAYDETTGMSTGYAATSFNGMYSIGKGFNDKNYFYAFAGGTFRSGNYSDMVMFGGEYGHKFFDQLWVTPFIDFNFSLYNGEIPIPTKQVQNGFYVNNQEYMAWGLKLTEEINDNFGVTFGFGGAMAGNNVAGAPAISLGAYYKW